mgnify:FL=1
MACSPHRAEILSSSLEAFKKVRQITSEKNLLLQSKRREAAQLLIEESFAELPSQKPLPANSNPDMHETAFDADGNSQSVMKASVLPILDGQSIKEQHKRCINVPDSNEISGVCAL